MTTTPEMRFCVRYLLDHGVNALNFSKVASVVTASDSGFEIVKKKNIVQKPFFEELAEKLRELWPPGEKDGKYPWRDSVSNLARRLETLWLDRFQNQDKQYTIEQCLTVARKYLAQFENDTKYMKVLKYFILKQDSIVDRRTGRLIYSNKSILADMLESTSDFEAIDEQWETTISNTTGEGELI